VDRQERLAREFERQRPHLRAVAYRMLGSLSEADDAVQDAWLRFSRAQTSDVENLRAWLTTVVARVALNMLRTRRTRREQPLEVSLPDPVIDPADGTDPEHEALLADSVGLAVLIVLETLAPAERIAFVLHDMFAVPFDQIAPIVERSAEATRQLASRARRRVSAAAPTPDTDLEGQWEVVEAFLAAARHGDFDALVAVLDPDIVLRVDGGRTGLSKHVQGVRAVATQAQLWARVDLTLHRVRVNGAAGMVSFLGGRPFSIGTGTVRNGRIVELDFLVDPDRIARLDLTALDR
jgi:RNA polymerase sigma factor (sigma-70 family)